MRLFFILAIFLMPFAAMSQGVWERPDAGKNTGNQEKNKRKKSLTPTPNILKAPSLKLTGR